MKTLVGLLLLSAILQVQVPPPPPPPPTRVSGEIPQTGGGVIEGLVKRVTGGEPVGEAQVVLTGSPAAATGTVPQLLTVTDSEGRFVFRNLPIGRYTVSARRESYFTTPASVAHVIEIDSLRKTASTTLNLIRGGTISGRILDPEGRPAVVATVTAARLNYQDGRPTLVPVKTTTSDDRGEYRLYWLEPGDYFVRAEKNLTTGPARSYFPGAENVIAATSVMVSEGTETAKTDFVLRKTVLVKVSGVVINVVPGFESSSVTLAGQNAARDSLRAAREAEAAQAGMALQFYLSPMEPGGVYDSSVLIPNALTSSQDRAAGRFELRNVRSGTYELYAVIQDRNTTPARFYMAHTMIDVGLQDMTDVALTIAPGADLNGRVFYSGNASPARPPVRVQLRPKDVLPNPAMALGLSAPVSQDGTFSISNVPDLRYSVSIGPLAGDAYLADIRLGSRTFFDRGAVTLPRELRDILEVVVAAPAGAISGTVSASPQQLASGVTVTLVPEEIRWENIALYKRAIATAAGNFSFANVTPGRYKLFAWEGIPDGAEKNTEFMGPYWDRGTEIAVSPGNTSAAPLRLILK